MVKFFIHVALDRYGAECLAKSSRLLEDICDSTRERHIYVWAGIGSPPENDDYWTDRYPRWDDSLPIPYDPTRHGGVGFDLDRDLLAKDLATALFQQEYRDHLSRFLADWPVKKLGPHKAFHPTTVLVGSVADPSGSSILLGLLAGLARLRKVGFKLPLTTYCLCGCGHESQDISNDAEQVRVLVAQSLFDLAHFFHSADRIADRAAPPYLVGEEPILGTEPDRKTQIALGGMALIGLTRSVTSDHTPAESNHFSPFRFEIDADQRVLFANEKFDQSRPFTGVGGYAVSCPAKRLSRLLAARVCKESIAALENQPAFRSVEECSKLETPPDVAKLLSDIQNDAIALIWKRLIERHKIPWDPDDDQPQVGWFELDRIRLIFEPVFQNKDWKRVIDSYGEDRFKAIPLEDWNGSIDELEQAIEQGFIPRRRLYLSEIMRGVLRTFLDGLDSACSEIFARTFHPPVGHTPHRCAHAFLGGIYRHLREKQQELEKLKLLSRRGTPSESPRRRRLRRLRQRISDYLSAVPSPAAVLLRLVPVFGLSVVLILFLPFDLKSLNSTPMRLLLGAGLGLLGAGLLFIRHVERVRRKLLSLFREWFAHYQAVLDDEDEILKEQTYSQLLVAMVDCLGWFLSGDEPEPPIPQPFKVRLETHRLEEKVDTPFDQLSAKEVLSEHPKKLPAAKTAYAELEERFLRDFQVSYLETILPEVTIDDQEILDGEYRALFSDALSPEYDHIDDLMRNILAWLDQSSAEDSAGAAVPYHLMGKEGRSSAWRRSFVTPDGLKLLESETRETSSGFKFLCTVREFIEGRLSGKMELPSRIRAYQERVKSKTISGTELSNRYSRYSSPSIPGDLERLAHYVVAAGSQDGLASSAGWDNNQGARALSIHLQACLFLSAASIVFFPNEENPSRALGRAWKAHLASPKPGKALAPVRFPPEDDA